MSEIFPTDPMAYLPCVIFVVAVPAMFVFSLREARRRHERAAALAQELGFELQSDGAVVEHAMGDPADPRIGNLSAEQSRRLAPMLKALSQLASGFRMFGRHRGYDVTIRSVSRGSGKSRKTYTQFSMTLPAPLGIGLQLGREGLFSKLGQAISGNQDVRIGDPNFDDRVLVRATDAASARDLLSRSAARESLLALIALDPGARVDDRAIELEFLGLRLDPDDARGILEAMAEVAAALTP